MSEPESVAGYTIRPYRPGDEGAITASFEAVFGETMSDATWRWKYASEPTTAVVGVRENDGVAEVVGHYGVMPMPLSVDGRMVAAGQPVDSFCLNRSGSVQHMIFARCYHELVRRFCGPGNRYGVLFGFPNAGVLRLGQRLLGYPKRPPRISVLTTELAGSVPSRLNRWLRRYRDESVPSPSEIDELWSRSASRYPVTVVRDGAWLKRRFLDRPGIEYPFITVRREGRLKVWVACRSAGHVFVWVDLVWDGDDAADLIEANRRVQQRALAGGHRSMLIWLLGDDEAESLLRSQGWSENRQTKLWFTHRFYDPAVEPNGSFAERFYATMAVSDNI